MANKEVKIGDDWYLGENDDGDLIVVNSNTGKVVKAIDKETGDEDKKGNRLENVFNLPNPISYTSQFTPKVGFRGDDGPETLYTNAYQQMTKYGFTGTIFVITKAIQDGDWSNVNVSHNSPPLSIDQIQEMYEDGWEIGMHTHTHPDTTNITQSELDSELSQCSNAIENWIGERPESLAFPYDNYNEDNLEVARTYARHMYGSSHVGYTPKQTIDRYIGELNHKGRGYLDSEERDRNSIYKTVHDPTESDMSTMIARAVNSRLSITSLENLGPKQSLFNHSQREFDYCTTLAGDFVKDTETTFWGMDQVAKCYSSGGGNYHAYSTAYVPTAKKGLYKIRTQYNCSRYVDGYTKLQIVWYDESYNEIETTDLEAIYTPIDDGNWRKITGERVRGVPPEGASFGQARIMLGNWDGDIKFANFTFLAPVHQQLKDNGLATLTSGNTSVTVSHGLPTYPLRSQITITPSSDLGSASYWYISNVTDTDFDINVDADPTQDVDFGWSIDITHR